MYTVHKEKTKERVFKLRLKGQSYSQISEKTNVPVPTVGYWVRTMALKSKQLSKIRAKAGPKKK